MSTIKILQKHEPSIEVDQSKENVINIWATHETESIPVERENIQALIQALLPVDKERKSAEEIIEQIKSLKQALHSLRLTNDITLIGKESMEVGFDVFINALSQFISQPVLPNGEYNNLKAEICDKLGNPIDALDSYIQFARKESGDTENLLQANELIERVKQIFSDFRSEPVLPPEEKEKWISVEDMLPEKGKRISPIFIFVKGEHNPYYAESDWDGSKFLEPYYGQDMINEVIGITHWFLPSPPKSK